MREADARAVAKLEFGDLVNARLSTLGLTVRQFATIYNLTATDVHRIINGEPVTALVVLHVLDALGWSAESAAATLDRLPEIPVKGGQLIAANTTTAQASPPSNDDTDGDNAVLMRAYFHPRSMRLTRLDIVRPDLLPSLDDTSQRLLIGDGWKARYTVDYVAMLTGRVQTCDRGGEAAPVHGINGNGRDCRVVFSRYQGGLVLATYEQLGATVRSIGPRWRFASFQHGKFAVAKCDTLEVPTRERPAKLG